MDKYKLGIDTAEPGSSDYSCYSLMDSERYVSTYIPKKGESIVQIIANLLLLLEETKKYNNEFRKNNSDNRWRPGF